MDNLKISGTAERPALPPQISSSTPEPTRTAEEAKDEHSPSDSQDDVGSKAGDENNEKDEKDEKDEDDEDDEESGTYERHMSLLSRSDEQQDLVNATTAPIFTMPVVHHLTRSKIDVTYPQYGLLAGLSNGFANRFASESPGSKKGCDPRLFYNIASPSSTFICGSQGSGKSHTLSVLLENALFPNHANKLPVPLTGLVFHYDSFISDTGGNPCEAAYLSSNKAVKVRVLCAPTNIAAIRQAYQNLDNVTIEPLRIDQSDLNTTRMMQLMAVNKTSETAPLYINSLKTILGKMRLEQQETGGTFDYLDFRRRIKLTNFSPDQLRPLEQRLQNLENFMPQSQTLDPSKNTNHQKRPNVGTRRITGNDWTPVPGCLTIVDLSCPCVTPESACSLFNICLALFLEQRTNVGKIIAVDEAHKYMDASSEALNLTDTLLHTVRMQRHLGARIIISTQEPTISPQLLDLSSVTIVHRFTSPEWLKTLEAHLAGAASKLLRNAENPNGEAADDNSSVAQKVFNEVVKLGVGEALLFSPSAMIALEHAGTEMEGLKSLGATYVKIRVRSRLTEDGGKSVMAC